MTTRPGPPADAGTLERGLGDDYAALRTGVGARSVGRDVVLVVGTDAEPFLQGQLSQDVAGMSAGECRDALLLEPDGKLCALLRVTSLSPGRYALDADAGSGELIEARLRRFRLRTKVDFEQMAWPCVALRGPEARRAARSDASGPDGPWILPVEWGGPGGLDVLGPGALDVVDAGVRWCGSEAWEALRIESGIPAMGRELDGRTIAAEADLLDRAVSSTKGCYTGQELLARLSARGNRVVRHLRGLMAAGGNDRPSLSVLAAGGELFDPDSGKPVGRCTSATWCPGLRAVAGLGYVHRSIPAPGTVAAARPDGPLVEVRPLPLLNP